MVGDRLKELRTHLNFTQQEFALQLNLKQSIFSLYENNQRGMSFDILKRIREVTNCNLTWLITGDGEMFNIPKTQPKITEFSLPKKQQSHLEDISDMLIEVDNTLDSFYEIPVMAEIAAGLPDYTGNDEPLEIVSIPSKYVNDPNRVVCFKVSGHSMEPTILPGDLVLITKTKDVLYAENKICGFRTPDGITLKRLLIDRKTKTVILLPINTEFEAQVYDPDDTEIELIGVLTFLYRRFME